MKKGLLSVFLAFMMMTAAVSCGGNGGSQKTGDGGSDTTSDSHSGSGYVEPEKPTDTGDYILKDSETDYKLVLPADADRTVMLAAEEFTAFFNEATDAYIEKVTDSEAVYNADAHYISIGNTSCARQAGVIADKSELGEQGYIIKTVGKSLFMTGATEYGTLYSVYGFFETEFGYDYYAPDIYALDRGVKNVPLREYDVKSVPDIESFAPNYGSLMSATNVTARYRMTSRGVTAMAINGTTSVHTELLILPIENYGEAHPKWYTDWKETTPNYQYEENLCLTAHGDAAEYAALVDAFCGQIYEEFAEGSTGKFLIFGQMDGAPACECAKCSELANKYGAKSAVAILFLNDVLDKVYQWFDTDEGRPYKRDFYINIENIFFGFK